ncbi:hypothetical protein ZIOFF_069925 [Zingiber officinale]|uniref:Putative gamma-glutamylcyclotransferase n=1 Tax=Zingiber officinale TaxID=94328 RepID=A0A8J5EUB6_ZINOF|nr:hypothetical protein ZIOFF_069925 [Zingiber officinale]
MAVATNVSAPHTVFVYDTLMDDQVVQALLKHVPPSSSAVLNHYHRYSIKGRVYPAILPVETKKVTGKVLFGITNVELDVLDAFEDIEYERRVVEVSLLDKTEKLLVNAYVWSDKNDPNLYSEWDFETSTISWEGGVFFCGSEIGGTCDCCDDEKNGVDGDDGEEGVNDDVIAPSPVLLWSSVTCISRLTDAAEWKRLHKEGFLSMTLGFMDEIEQPDSKTRVATYESYFQS